MRRCLSLNIRLNGEPAETGAKNLGELCTMLGFETGAKIATAINGDFVAEAARSDQPLVPDDEIEIVAPRQGG